MKLSGVTRKGRAIKPTVAPSSCRVTVWLVIGQSMAEKGDCLAVRVLNSSSPARSSERGGLLAILYKRRQLPVRASGLSRVGEWPGKGTVLGLD